MRASRFTASRDRRSTKAVVTSLSPSLSRASAVPPRRIRDFGEFVSSGWFAALAVLFAVGCGQSPPADSGPGNREDSELEPRQSSLTTLSRAGWIASASSTGGTNGASNAIDGNATSRWRAGAAQAANQWFQVDMASVKTFTEIRLDTSGASSEYPRNYRVQVANNNTSWGTAPTVATGTGTTAVTTIAFAPQTARYIRVTLTAASTSFWSIYEFNVYGTALSRTGWTATASSTNGSNVAGNALDGSTTTRWSSAGAQTGQWFKVDMKSPRTFNQIVLDAGTTTNNFPRGYAVFVSNDDVNWGAAVATGTGTTALVVVTLAFQHARYIRIDQTATNSTTWSIQELNVEGQPTTQIAQPRAGWLATASTANGSNVAANALDGSSSTRWSTAGAQTNQWFQVDMLAARIFDRITLDAGTTTNNFPRGYQVSISNDGTGWTAVATGTGTTALVTITLVPARTARHVRINQTATSSATWSIQEMDVTGPTLSPQGWVATASSTNGTNAPGNAIDGTATTRWSTASGQTGQWFQVDMGTAQIFNQLTLNAGTTPNNFPRGYSVSVSNDGTNWGSAIATGAGTSQVVTVGFPDQTARFLRINQTATSSTTWSIQELHVWRIGGLCDPVTCAAQDACHLAGVCDPATGLCSNPIAADGTACNDGNLCTQTDTCQSGACTGSNPVTCTAQDQCHAIGTCAPATGICSNPAKPDGTTCNDSAVCTQSESCVAGSCQNTSPFPVIINLLHVDVGSLGGSTFANDINTSGSIVGSSNSHAYMKTATGPMIDLGALPGFGSSSGANAINEAGTVAGTMTHPDGSHPFRYTAANGLEDLGLGGDGLVATDINGVPRRGAVAFDINSAGQLAGWMTEGGLVRGYRYTDGVGFEDIGSLAGGATSLSSVADSGRVVGNSWVSGPPQLPGAVTHAVMYENEVVGIVDLNDLIDPMAGWTLWHASDAAGDFVAGYGDRGGVTRAFRLRVSTGAIEEISGGWEGNTLSAGLNAAGDMVGSGFLDAAGTIHKGFVYTDQLGFKTLNDIIDPASGWDLRVPSSINATGDIVGWGYHNGVISGFHLRLPAGQAATCQARGICGGGETICLYSDGVVEKPDGSFVAVFGYDSSATTSITPATNEVRIDSMLVTNPQPAPPAMLPPGTHPGAYLATFAVNQTISWTVDGQTVSESAANPSRILPTVPIGASGYGVMIGGTLVTIQPDLAPWSQPPPEPTAQNEPTPGDTFNGVLTGQLSVSATGAAVYSVPIAIPPGIAGMAPNLSLVYSSQAGPGVAGQGWSLTGLSVIHRCPRTKVQDGFGHQVTMDDSDLREAVCLDGQRMFEQAGAPAATHTFKLERDDHSTITKTFDVGLGEPAALGGVWFKVVTKTGETRFYGQNTRTRVTLTPGGPVAIWALERVMDAWGNYYDVHYVNESAGTFATGGLEVASIDYTGHLPTTSSGEIPPFEHVYFDYDSNPRPDARVVRFGELTLPRTKRLTGIRSSAGRYYLTYLPDDDPMLPSRLGSINYCPRQDCPATVPATPEARRAAGFLQALEFDWEVGGYLWDPAPSFAPPEPMERFGDNREKSHGTRFVDLDGDGRLDLVRSSGSATQTSYSRARRNTGAGWQNVDQWALPVGLAHDDGTPTGATLADMDGDGLLDVVSQERVSCLPPLPQDCRSEPTVWLNRIRDLEAPQPWLPQPGYRNVAEPWNGSAFIDFRTTDKIADMNGDGKADLVRFGPGTHEVQVRYGTGTGWTVPPENYSITSFCGEGGDATYCSGFTGMSNMTLEDVNRDGLPDMVWGRSDGLCVEHAMGINTGANTANGTVWKVTRWVPTCSAGGYAPADKRAVGDIDGDGFRDIVASFRTELNTETQTCTGQNCCPSECSTVSCTPAGCSCSCPTSVTVTDNAVAVTLATGNSWTLTGVDSYRGSLAQFRPHPGEDPIPPSAHKDFIFAMADLNADGLGDFILNHSDGGQALFNRSVTVAGGSWGGSGPRFVDLYGRTNWEQSAGPILNQRVPIVPTDDKDFPSEGAAFVDLDGDGVTDLVHAKMVSGQLVSNAWLNRFKPPVIKSFPNGLARPSEVTYAVITTAAAQAETYLDTAPTPELGTTFFATPLRVVQSVRAEDGTASGTLFQTDYVYESLRASAHGRGPQGFAKVTAVDKREGSNPAGWRFTETRYSQVYPYTGVPLEVRRSVGGSQLTATATSYCNTFVENPEGVANCTSGAFAPGTSLFVYPRTIIDQSYLHRDDAPQATPNDVIRTRTDYHYDAAGNPIKTTVTIDARNGVCDPNSQDPELACPRHQKTVVNSYETNSAGISTEDLTRLGKPTLTTVTAQSLMPLGGARSHTTEFRYSRMDGPIALTKKIVEPGAAAAGETTELHTAYDYDAFGNVTNTTDCASDFGFCFPTPYPSPTNPGHRRTAVSYDPTSFTPPPGGRISALPAELKGRFPVRTINPAGHVEYTAYDPVRGALLQKTGPNGIHTCFEYDDLGRESKAIERCGVVGQELVTATDRFQRAAADPAWAKVVTRTRAPTGVASWSYVDALGRATATRGRSFDGGFTESYTLFDRWGRTARQSAPYVAGQPVFETVTTYDSVGDRVRTVARELGAIDGTGTPRRAIQTFKYYGRMVRTEHNVDGEDEAHLHQQQREETKNVLGKVESVLDANGERIVYLYDADGNLTDTTSPTGNFYVHIDYDTRGRKKRVVDRDLGTWTYVHDGFGDLLSQKDAKGQSTGEMTTMTYDVLGRMTSKTDATGTARWVYDEAPGAGKGKLAAMVGAPDPGLQGQCPAPYDLPTDGNRAVRSFAYDTFGQLVEATECADGQSFAVNHLYDAFGREQQVTYPAVGETRLAVQYVYTSLGFLRYVADAADGGVYWAATEMNALGQVTREQTRNGVETASNRNPSTGWLLGSQSIAHADGGTLIRSWQADFDEVGNLRRRLRDDPVSGPASDETFTYDALNRLRASRVQILSEPYDRTETYDIDAVGNLTRKDDKVFTYGAAGGCPTGGIHAICTVNGGAQFQYDPNGNMLSGNGKTVEYNPANKPVQISGGGNTVTFMYGADGHRVVQEATGGGSVARTVYVGLGATGKSMYERTTRDGVAEHTHFLYAGGAHGGAAFAVKVMRAGSPAPTTSYYHTDHLGSVTALSDERGHVVGPAWGGGNATVLGYDPWGARREPGGRPGEGMSFQLQAGHREFTGHETIPGVGLVNMNGRVYDPALGRFLSPDPNVQFVGDLQSYNRYSYALNNPLRYTDPTGYSIGEALGSLVSIGLGFATMGVCISTGGGGCVLFTLLTAYYQTTTMMMAGASFEQALAANAIGIGAGFAGGLAGGAITQAAGGSLSAQMVGGAVSGAVSTAFTAAVLQHDLSASDLLVGATSGAVSAAIAAGMSGTNTVSQASRAEAQGERPLGNGGATIPMSSGDQSQMEEVGYYDDYKKRLDALTPAERELRLRHRAKYDISRVAAVEAVEVTKLYFSPEERLDGRVGNAFQHGYWNARMTHYMGAAWAERFANAHENYGPGSILGKNEKMDLHNNAVGRRVGEMFSTGAAAQKILLLEAQARHLVWIVSTPNWTAPTCWAVNCTGL